MIDGLYSNLQSPQPATQDGPRKVLRMVKNERMGGSVPVWETIRGPVETALSNAQKHNDANAVAPDMALAYQAPDPHSLPSQTSEEFGFGDLIDMINPLHHVPVVGHVYRELSGDEIKPIAQIIGGAVFGGPMGAASGLVNVVVEQETGKDLTGNAMAFAFKGETPKFQENIPPTSTSPEIRLAAAQNSQQTNALDDIPGNLLTFVDMKARPEIVIERVTTNQERMAGAITKISYPDLEQNPLPVREPITQVRLSQRFND